MPAVLRAAIDRSLTGAREPLMPYVLAVIGLGIARGVLTAIYRYGLFHAGYNIDSDLADAAVSTT